MVGLRQSKCSEKELFKFIHLYIDSKKTLIENILRRKTISKILTIISKTVINSVRKYSEV